MVNLSQLGPRTLTPKLKAVCERLGIDVSHYKAPPGPDYCALVDQQGICQPSAADPYCAPTASIAADLRRRGVPALVDPFADPETGDGGEAAYLSQITHNATFKNPPHDDAPVFDADGKPVYYCKRSRYVLAGPSDGGKTRIVAAPCNANFCPYCGRRKMYRKRNRMYDSFKLHRQEGMLTDGRYLFITFTMRHKFVSNADAFRFAKPALAYAVQKLRKPRSGKSSRGSGRRRRGGWPGLKIGYCNDVDLQPGTKMAHGHAIVLVQPLKGHKMPCSKQIARELHHHISNYIYRKLGLIKRSSYRKGSSPCYVHVSDANNEQNIANYMALHNGKVCEPWREYPRRYRRFSASKGFLKPMPVKEASSWLFVPRAASWIAARAGLRGLVVSDLSAIGDSVQSFALDAPPDAASIQALLEQSLPSASPPNLRAQRQLDRALLEYYQYQGTDYYNGPPLAELQQRQQRMVARSGHTAEDYHARIEELERLWQLDAQEKEARELGLCWSDYELWCQGRLE